MRLGPFQCLSSVLKSVPFGQRIIGTVTVTQRTLCQEGLDAEGLSGPRPMRQDVTGPSYLSPPPCHSPLTHCARESRAPFQSSGSLSSFLPQGLGTCRPQCWNVHQGAGCLHLLTAASPGRPYPATLSDRRPFTFWVLHVPSRASPEVSVGCNSRHWFLTRIL